MRHRRRKHNGKNSRKPQSPVQLTIKFRQLTKENFSISFSDFEQFYEYEDHATFLQMINDLLKKGQTYPDSCLSQFAEECIRFSKASIRCAKRIDGKARTSPIYDLALKAIQHAIPLLKKLNDYRNLAEAYYIKGVTCIGSLHDDLLEEDRLASEEAAHRCLEKAHQLFLLLHDFPKVVSSAKQLLRLTTDNDQKELYKVLITQYKGLKKADNKTLAENANYHFRKALAQRDKLKQLTTDLLAYLKILDIAEDSFRTAHVIFNVLKHDMKINVSGINLAKCLLKKAQYYAAQGDSEAANYYFEKAMHYFDMCTIPEDITQANNTRVNGCTKLEQANEMLQRVKSQGLAASTVEDILSAIESLNSAFYYFMDLKDQNCYLYIAHRLAESFTLLSDKLANDNDMESADTYLRTARFYFKISHPNKSLPEHLQDSFATARNWHKKALRNDDPIQKEECKAYALRVFQQTVAKGIAFGETDHVIKELEGSCHFQ